MIDILRRLPANVTAPSIHDKAHLLERKKTGDFLTKKIRARPSRQQLIQRHILSDHRVDPGLLETLGKLERQKIADHLNEHLLARPGPIELIQERILPVESPIQNAVENFENTLSPTSSSGDAPSVSEFEINFDNCVSPSPPPQPDQFSETFRNHRLLRHVSSDPNISKLTISQNFSLSQKENEKLVRTVNKKVKQAKSKVKKLKFHECRPPEMPEAPTDNQVDERYQRLLEQQTLYLRLQVMQQNAMMNALQGNTNSMEAVTEEIENVINKEKKSLTESTGLKSVEGRKLDELRVIELRAQLKQRGLLVSGSKAKLIERLIAFQEGKSTPTDFSYSGSLSGDLQKLTSPTTSDAESPPSTTVMVTTYATDATGQTYQVVQAVPRSSQNIMQYEVLNRPSMSPIHMEHVNIQPVVAVTQPHVMTIRETVSDAKHINAMQHSPSQIQFHLTPPPQQPSPTIVLHQGPAIQRAALMQHERHKVAVQHMQPNIQGQYFTQNHNHNALTQLSQSLPATQFSSNYVINSSHGNMTPIAGSETSISNHTRLTNTNSLDLLQQFRGRTSSEPASHFKRSQSYGDGLPQQQSMLNGLDKNSNLTHNQMISSSSFESVRASGSYPTLSSTLYPQCLTGVKTDTDSKSPENYDDIMDILGELSTPSPTNIDAPVHHPSPLILNTKSESPPSYNSCVYDSPKQQQNQINNKFLNINNQANKFSSVPENINVIRSASPNQNFMSTPFGSLGTNSLGGSMTNLQSQQSGSFGNLNQTSSTGNLSSLSNDCLSNSTYANANSGYLKMEYGAMSPMSIGDEHLNMDLEHFPSSSTQNTSLNWLDLNMESTSPPSLNYQPIQTKDSNNSGSYSNLSNPGGMIDMNSTMIPSNSLYGGNTRNQTSIYGSSPRPQDGFASLFDLEGGEY